MFCELGLKFIITPKILGANFLEKCTMHTSHTERVCVIFAQMQIILLIIFI